MKYYNNKVIIGIDHGYGNIKTANHIFKAGIAGYDHEPLFTADMLVYGGRYYVIGEGHKEFVPQKQSDEDYYLLTLAGIAMELKDEGLTEADVIIAGAGGYPRDMSLYQGTKAIDNVESGLKPGGTVALSFNAQNVKTELVRQKMQEAGMEVMRGGAWDGFSHWVEQAITRDVAIARRGK